MTGEIEPAGLAAAIEDGEAPRLVDIRPPGSFGQGHIPGSENVPLAELIDEVERFAGDEHVVTICPHGKASLKAARLITAYGGFEGRVESLRGGLEAWDGPLTAPSPPGDEESAAPF